jgi:hypothetical protein
LKIVSTHSSRSAADPGAEDRGTGGEDVNNGAVVGEAGPGVTRGSGTDSAGLGLGGGGVVGSVGVVVTGSDGQEDTGVDKGSGGAVDSGRLAATERHVGDGTVGAVAGLGVAGDEVDTSNDARAKKIKLGN